MTADTVGTSQPRAAMLTVALCFAVMVVEGFDIRRWVWRRRRWGLS